MFDHVTIRVSDRVERERLGNTILRPLRFVPDPDGTNAELVNHNR